MWKIKKYILVEVLVLTYKMIAERSYIAETLESTVHEASVT